MYGGNIKNEDRDRCSHSSRESKATPISSRLTPVLYFGSMLFSMCLD